MSNYGNMGSAAINSGVQVAQAMRAQDNHNAQAPERELKKEHASLANLQLDMEIDQAGGRAKYVSNLAQQARQEANLKAEKQALDVQKKQAQISKINAQAAKAMMRKAPTGGNKTRKVPVISAPNLGRNIGGAQ